MPRQTSVSRSEWLREIISANRSGQRVGVFSVCSAHPDVLRASMRQALDDGAVLLVESTSNQVNQFGGYTGMNPAQFVDHLFKIADEVGLESDKIIIGSDHLGPYPWRAEPFEEAFAEACALARSSVLAGYSKIHLDASMPCADDPMPLDDRTIAQRTAQLCSATESAFTEHGGHLPPPLYVIGSEVPTPGGEQSQGLRPEPTTVEHMRRTLDHFRDAFVARNVHDAWQRVIGLVVQSGADFSESQIFDYDSRKGRPLRQHLPESPALAYEAHSTDYQTPMALREMVEDHFAILKVGPWLTFAYREAIFTLGALEHDWLGGRKDVRLSSLRRVLEAAMLRNPKHWRGYFTEQEAAAQSFWRQFSYSDRCRYYWPDAEVKKEVDLLLRNLSSVEIPHALISQHFPEQYERVRTAEWQATPRDLIERHIRKVLTIYSSACGASSSY